MTELASRRATSGLKRVFGNEYMQMRRLTEARLHELFIEAGGEPERRAPHYFCLGNCDWFRELAPGMREVVIPLSQLPNEVTSFTYPDSFTAMGFGPKFDIPYGPRPYHGQVFRLSSLDAVIGEYGLPVGDADPEYEGYQHRPFEKYIEIQVWSDQPVEGFA